MTTPVLPVDLGDGVLAGFTVGNGVAAPPNLSVTVGDAEEALRRRADLARWAGAPLAFIHQVHGADVHIVRGPVLEPPSDALPPADAVVVAGPSAAAVVLVADCVPVLLADPCAGVVAAVHAGRRGVVAGVVAAAVEAMTRLGASPAGLRAVVGPAICGACYEVPAVLRDEVSAVVPGAGATTGWGTPALDLPGAVRGQLRDAGVAHVASVGGCTLEDSRWYSHRGTAAGRPAGRLAGAVRTLRDGL